MSEHQEARTERVTIGFTREEFAQINALRLQANRAVSMATFCRSVLLDVAADDQAAHTEAAE